MFDDVNLQLQRIRDEKIKTLKSRSGDAGKVKDYLFQRPNFIDVQKVAEVTEKI